MGDSPRWSIGLFRDAAGAALVLRAGACWSLLVSGGLFIDTAHTLGEASVEVNCLGSRMAKCNKWMVKMPSNSQAQNTIKSRWFPFPWLASHVIPFLADTLTLHIF